MRCKAEVVVAGDFDSQSSEAELYASWRKQIAESPVVDLFAVAAPSPTSLIWSSGEGSRFIVSCLAYRVGQTPNSPVEKSDLVAEVPVAGGIDALAPDHAIQPYRIVHMRVRLAEYRQGTHRAHIEEIVKSVLRDDPLESIAEGLKQPLVVRDEQLGDFTLDRSIGYFDGQIRYRWRRVELSVQAATPDELRQHLKAFKLLISNLKEIDAQARKSVTHELQEIYNTSWREPWRPVFRGNDLGRKIRLKNVTFNPGSRLTLWYDAGRLFCDHEVEVRCEPDGKVFEVCVSG